MPYYRKKPLMSTSRFNKKKKFNKKRSSISPYIKKYVNYAIQHNSKLEHKHVTHYVDESSFSTLTGQYNVQNFYQISQGTAATQRAGLKVSPSGISIRGNLCYNSTTAAKTCYVRLVLIETPQNEVFTALSTELFKDTAANGAWGSLGTTQMQCIWAPLNNCAYKFHWDKVYKLNAISADGSFSRLVKKWIPLKGNIHYDANSVGAGNQSRNFALVMILAEAGQDVGAGETVEFSMVARTYFTDA